MLQGHVSSQTHNHVTGPKHYRPPVASSSLNALAYHVMPTGLRYLYLCLYLYHPYNFG
jgi:hypothetical protein